MCRFCRSVNYISFLLSNTHNIFRFCCPQFQQGDCDKEGYEWTDWLDRDDPTADGDYERIHDFSTDQVCQNPIALEAQARSSGATEITHVDLNWGFWCVNEENEEECADFEVRYCCPKTSELKCEQEGYAWTVWLDRDDPTDTGDWENKDGFPANVVCATPTAVEAQIKSGSVGSSAVTHLDNDQGFWCIHDEQPKDATCADFEVRFCCPEEYNDPCGDEFFMCAENQHVVYQTLSPTNGECTCECDQGYILNATTTRNTGNSTKFYSIINNIFCLEDWECENSHGTCVRFYKNSVTWAEARSYCMSIDADLVSVFDATYQAWVCKISQTRFCNFLNLHESDQFLGYFDHSFLL